MKSTKLFIAFLLLSSTQARIFHRPREFRCDVAVVFGDTLSDDGVEAEGESHGFMRNSNGKVWSEYAMDMLQCNKYMNYAYSGAKSGQDNFYFDGWSGVAWQADRYLEHNPYVSENALVILQTGGTIDFFTGQKEVAPVVENIQKTIANITEVMSGGTLVVLSLLDLSVAPGVRTADESNDLRNSLSELIASTNRIHRCERSRDGRNAPS